MKKQNERSKRKLTSKQISIIAAIICAIYCVIAFIFLINSENNTAKFVITILTFVIIMIMTYIILQDFVLKDEAKRLKEKIEEKLQRDHFVEIELMPYEINKQTEMFEYILKNIGCKFYAKLLDSGEIMIIGKDRYDNTVYKELTENYYYFEATFKFKKD